MPATDKQTRFERYLAFLADHLKKTGSQPRLLYDDRPGGDILALAAQTPAGLCELVVERARADRATLILCAVSMVAVRHMSEAVVNRHREIQRLHSAMRAFVHRVERMAAELCYTYGTRTLEYPTRPLAALQRLASRAVAMVGVEGLIHGREHDEAAQVPAALAEGRGKQRRAAVRYPSRFAAMIPTETGGRAALYRSASELFEPRGEALAAVLRMLGNVRPEQWPEAGRKSALLIPRLSVTRKDGKLRVSREGLGDRVAGASDSVDAVDVVETAFDSVDVGGGAIEALGEAASGCTDFGSPCDLVDCGAIDCTP